MELTRRYFLKTTGALSAYLGVAPVSALVNLPLTPRVRVKPKKTLVVIFLRGGADGLNLVVPYGDSSYTSLRPSIAVPSPTSSRPDSALDLDGYFGLHPRLAELMPLFENDLAVAAHAVGYDQNTRSHFEEQDTWETGIIGNTVNSDGWLNRHLATSEGHGPVRAISVGDSLPRILQGKAPAYAIRGLNDLMLPKPLGDPRAVIAALEHAYQSDPMQHTDGARDLLNQTGQTTLDGIEQLRSLVGDSYTPAATYPQTDLARKLQEIARLIKADIGLEVAEVDLNGWDTHANQGAAAGGQLGNLAGQLGGAMSAFTKDLEDRLDDVLIVTLTDFGRTAAQNGTAGTDHGWANAMFVAGGAVRNAKRQAADGGRRVITKWPGLAPDQLHQGRDLLNTTDFRDVLAELVRVHLGNPNLESLLPGHEFNPVGLIA